MASGSPNRDDATRVETVMYGVAAVLLVGLGVLLDERVLNWIVGPGLVVLVVGGGTPLALRLLRWLRR